MEFWRQLAPLSSFPFFSSLVFFSVLSQLFSGGLLANMVVFSRLVTGCHEKNLWRQNTKSQKGGKAPQVGIFTQNEQEL